MQDRVELIVVLLMVESGAHRFHLRDGTDEGRIELDPQLGDLRIQEHSQVRVVVVVRDCFLFAFEGVVPVDVERDRLIILPPNGSIHSQQIILTENPAIRFEQ